MVYVKRDAQGSIVAVSELGDAEHNEGIEADDPQLQAFLAQMQSGGTELGATDQELIRVLEDVVGLLIEKGVILFTELPESAQEKIINRQRLRTSLRSALNLIGED